MRMSHIAACLILLGVASAAADEMPWGLYVMGWDGPGRATKRADADGQVMLRERVTHQLRDASLVSVRNDNELFRLSLVAAGVPEGADPGQKAVVVAGLCVPVSSHGERDPADGSVAVSGTVAGEAAAAKVAEALRVTPRLREHPGHQLVASVATAKGAYQPNEPVTLVMRIKNVGTTTVRFYDGGAQRGPRNNQFGFTAFRNGGHGRALSDTGDPTNFGGIMSRQTLAPGGTFTKSVDLSRWFTFDAPDGYLVTATYRMALLQSEASHETIWDEVAVATCTVRVVDPPPTTKEQR